MKSKWKKIVIWCAAFMIVIGAGGLWAANYAADKVMNSIIDSMEAELTAETGSSGDQASSTEWDAASNGQQPSQVEDKQEMETDSGQSATPEEADEPAKVATGTVSAAEGNNNDAETGSNPGPNPNYTANVTTEKMQEVKETVTVKDKAAVVSILLQSLSISDLKELQGIASEGLTVENKKIARAILLDKVSAEDYNTLSSIAEKYGVSEGRTYDEALESEARSQE